MPMTDIQANAAALVAAQTPREVRWYTSYTDAADYTRIAALIGTTGTPDLLRFETPGKSVGRLWVDADGVFQFEGNVGESAKQLFEMLTTLSEQSRKGN